MNLAGLTLWGLLAGKGLLRWHAARGQGHRELAKPPLLTAECGEARWLALATALILGYCLLSAWNARATYRPEEWSFDYHSAFLWLPHSYDSEGSWRSLGIWCGIAGFFWALRDWILCSPELVLPTSTGRPASSKLLPPLPSRLRLLLWVLSVNGAILGLEAILQRIVGTNKLLWLLETRINKEASDQFGPFAYRANGAQYFNLLWPTTLGFWLASLRSRRISVPSHPATPGTGHHLLLSCAMIMAICPLVSTSRGGAIVMIGSLVLVGVVITLARWESTLGVKLAVFLFLVSIVGGGVLLGWEELGPRLESLQEGAQLRESMYATGRRMASDNPLFGTGPGSFNHLFQLYRSSRDEYWPAQLHNDWLEFRITLGWVGMALIGLGLSLALAKWFFPGRCLGDKYFMMMVWIALGGCLLHARFDFPFQIHSIFLLFVMLCSVASCLSVKVDGHA